MVKLFNACGNDFELTTRCLLFGEADKLLAIAIGWRLCLPIVPFHAKLLHIILMPLENSLFGASARGQWNSWKFVVDKLNIEEFQAGMNSIQSFVDGMEFRLYFILRMMAFLYSSCQ